MSPTKHPLMSSSAACSRSEQSILVKMRMTERSSKGETPDVCRGVQSAADAAVRQKMHENINRVVTTSTSTPHQSCPLFGALMEPRLGGRLRALASGGSFRRSSWGHPFSWLHMRLELKKWRIKTFSVRNVSAIRAYLHPYR